jgi:tetratricopeptide (TPR) repeat protein
MRRFTVGIVVAIVFCASISIASQPLSTAKPGDSVEVYLAKGGMALKSQEYDRAIGNFQAALRIDSLNVMALRNIGTAFAAKGNNVQARVYLERANQLKPNDAEICNNLGVIFSNSDNSNEAIRYFEAAVAADSTSALYLTSLGVENLKIGRVQKALPILQKASALAPKNPIPLFSIGSCFAADRKYDSAAAYFERSVVAGGNAPELYYFLGVAKRQLGDLDAAEKNYKLGVERNPNYKECLQALGLLYAQRQKFVAAQSYFERVIAVDSLFYPAWVSLGATAALTEQMERADTILYMLFKKDSTLGFQMINLINLEMSKRQGKSPVDSTAKPPKK